MPVPRAEDVLAIWERGLARHPIDRALLLAAWARPDEAAERLADLPLGEINRTLLKLRELWFGAPIQAYADCAACGERAELSLDPAIFAFPETLSAPAREVEVLGFRFRAPTSRDLAAVATESDVEDAALRLLDRCRMEPLEAPSARLLAEVEEKLEAIDPAAEITLSLTCAACGAQWATSLDPGALLWDDLEAHAHKLVAEVDALARTYGWTEREILALSPQRRTTYLAMVAG